MPIYTFTCPECGTEYDQIVAMGVDVSQCPTCNKEGKRSGQETPARRNPDYGIQR